MDHDFDQNEYNTNNEYVYKYYNNGYTKCRGLMDYVDDGVGWSKCSARDISRFLMAGGLVKEPRCLKSTTNTNTNKVNGNWGSWGTYGSCSRTCGGGSQTRSR